jgi:hypothetical protein
MNDISSLRQVERACLEKLDAKARQLMAADPRLSLEAARGKAILAMPNCSAKYQRCQWQLQACGLRGMTFKDL